MRAVHPGSRVPLARTSRRSAQAHRGGGLAPAHRGGTHPLTRTGGPRGRCPSVDPRAPAGPHIHCAPVARVRPLTPTRAALCRARSTMPRRRGDGPGHTRAAAERRRRPSGVWWRTRWRRQKERTLPHGATWRAVRGPSSTRPPSRPSAP